MNPFSRTKIIYCPSSALRFATENLFSRLRTKGHGWLGLSLRGTIPRFTFLMMANHLNCFAIRLLNFWSRFACMKHCMVLCVSQVSRMSTHSTPSMARWRFPSGWMARTYRPPTNLDESRFTLSMGAFFKPTAGAAVVYMDSTNNTPNSSRTTNLIGHMNRRCGDILDT